VSDLKQVSDKLQKQSPPKALSVGGAARTTTLPAPSGQGAGSIGNTRVSDLKQVSDKLLDDRLPSAKEVLRRSGVSMKANVDPAFDSRMFRVIELAPQAFRAAGITQPPCVTGGNRDHGSAIKNEWEGLHPLGLALDLGGNVMRTGISDSGERIEKLRKTADALQQMLNRRGMGYEVRIELHDNTSDDHIHVEYDGKPHDSIAYIEDKRKPTNRR
jgi:hypothetical protein